MTSASHHTASSQSDQRHHVVIVGGGFGGLYAARKLGPQPLDITLIDRRNFHLFQPLLYQVATGGLSPGDIASPLRAVLNRYRNVRVLQATVVDIDPQQRTLITDDARISYDTLILAAGARNHYFGNDGWSPKAPGLKSIEDALEMRRRIFTAFEMAEKTADPEERRRYLNFVVVGGGPTGVELAGALGELTRYTLRNDFRTIDTTSAAIHLIEGGKNILATYPDSLIRSARQRLEKLGVTLHCNTMVTDINDHGVRIKQGESVRTIEAHTILWGAGVKVSPLAAVVKSRCNAETDRSGRLIVAPDLSLPDHPEVCEDRHGQPLPGTAPVAMQQGHYVARTIGRRLRGKAVRSFRYLNKGNLAVIGRNAAVADFGGLRVSGWPAWLVWVFVHIAYLVEFESRVLVMFQWAYNYFTRKRGARLITMADAPEIRPSQADSLSA